jgi:hypothetical protein
MGLMIFTVCYSIFIAWFSYKQGWNDCIEKFESGELELIEMENEK